MWDVAIGYTVLRSVVAVLHGWWMTRRGASLLPVAAQATADVGAAGVLAACVDYRLREALGWSALAIAAYVVLWEAGSFVRSAVRVYHGDAVPDDEPSDAATMGRWLNAAWRVVFVLPPVAAAFALTFAILVPGALPLPSERPPMLCAPAELLPDDTLGIEMITPHGGQLTVTTPDGRSLTVVPFAPAATPAAQRFEHQRRVRLPVRLAHGRDIGDGRWLPVFRDTGTYVFHLHAIPDVSGLLSCDARLVSVH
jgi:hypothetical protein